MRVAVTCECGHVTEPDTQDVSHESASGSTHAEALAIRFCSQCGRSLAGATPLQQALPAEATTGPRTFQQLWQSRLNATEETASLSPSELGRSETTLPQATSSESTANTGSDETSGRRSLWAVMGGSAGQSQRDDHFTLQSSPAATSVPDRNSDAVPTTPAALAINTSEPNKPKGLWSVMSASVSPSLNAGHEHETVSDQPVDLKSQPSDDKLTSTPNVGRDSSPISSIPSTVPGVWCVQPPGSAQVGTATASAGSTSTSQPIRPSLLGLRRLSAGPIDEDEDYGTEWCWEAIAALVLGIAAIFLAALSLKPGWLVRIPSLVVGIVALMVGFTAIGDVRRARGQLKGRFAAVTGIVLGALGMLLAPLLFARMGDSWRESAGREVIANRLRQIGSALDQHHAQHGQFPPAVVYSKRVDAKQPLHGWMTALLPFLGHEPVHRRIDLTQSFDSPGNVAPMQQIIPEFLVPGRKPIRSQRGLGITHFAGVGGEAVNEQVGLMHLGIFAEEGAVRREQITDGLAQTIIVGEIVDPLPAWGEPGNLRSIGNGLNKQFHGFGNPAGTGATFLHADGSVKFYSNKTDRRVLQQLETRDGGN